MQNRNSMPFFWPKLVAQVVLVGTLASGCSAAGGGGDSPADGDPSFAAPSAPNAPTLPTAPAAPPVSNPSAAPPAPTTNTSTSSPVTNVPATNAPAGNAGNEAVPTPARDEDAAPADEEDGDDGANPPPANAGDDDDDDSGDDDEGGDDDDEGGDDDDDGGDDDDDDNGGDDDDDDDDDDDGTGVTPPPDPGDPAPDPGTPPPADAITFSADIRPILIANCGRCHASGGLPQFASANAATGYDVAFRERNSIVSEIRSGNMPADTCNGAPGSNGCVSVADFNLIQQWVAAGAPE